MKNIIKIMFFFAILLVSLVSLISADYDNSYIYAGNGVVVYPNYILRTVCKPFMPCGVERIDIPNYNSNNNINRGIDGSEDSYYDSLRTKTYNYYYSGNTQNSKPIQSVIIYTQPDQYTGPTPVKHFANTYNTRNNYDSNGNWIGGRNVYSEQPNSKTIIIYM